MSESFTVYHRGADGVERLQLPAAEALRRTRKEPWAYSLSRVFPDPPPGWVPSEGNGEGGGRGRVQGASVRAD